MFWLSVFVCFILLFLPPSILRADDESTTPPTDDAPPGDGGGEDTPPSPPPNPYEQVESEQMTRYRQMIEAQGGKVDASGNVTWPQPQVSMPPPGLTQSTDPYAQADPNEQVLRQLQAYEQQHQQRLAPIQMKTLLDEAIAADPSFARARKDAEAFLKQMDPSLLNEKAVQGALWMARGMQATVEVAEAQKKAWEDGLKANPTVQARAAQVEGGGEKPPTTRPAQKLSADEEREIAEWAQFGIKPEDLRAKILKERQTRRSA